MMAIEGPFLAAVIARLPDPKFNLAAWGVAFAFAILVEAPIIMIMSAATALAEDSPSFFKLRNFTYALNAIITAVMVLVLVPPVFDFIIEDLIGLPDEVAHLTYGALLLMLPWPAAIGYRRFFQGLLIRDSRTRLVAYGTVIRLSSMAATAFLLYTQFTLAGAYVGAAALSAGVCAEALASRLMARDTVRRLLATAGSESLSYRRIADFYYPLALTSVLALAAHPMVTFMLGRARYPVESLAVLPVVNSLSFLFRALGLSYQEVVIALLGRDREHVRALARFALWLAVASSLGMTLVGFTPLAYVWFETISGLSRQLADFAVTPTRIMLLLPATSVLLSLQRGILVQGRFTRPITWATVIELGGIVLVLMALTRGIGMVGATAAAIAYVAGRLAGSGYLVAPSLKVLRDAEEAAGAGV